jgi:hypothetical protein
MASVTDLRLRCRVLNTFFYIYTLKRLHLLPEKFKIIEEELHCCAGSRGLEPPLPPSLAPSLHSFTTSIVACGTMHAISVVPGPRMRFNSWAFNSKQYRP